MRYHKRAETEVNPKYQAGDPRRKEPGRSSVKRLGDNWRERWHATLDSRRFKEPVGIGILK